MNPNATPPRVILRHCDSYDPERIRQIVREGIQELGLRPAGRTLVKPNIVASGKSFPHAYTRPEVAEGVLLALRDTGGDAITELAVGERCGITIPTRYAFREAGYPAVVERVPGTKVYFFDEVGQVEIPLTHAGRLRDYVYTPEPVAKADFFVNMPKFKSHPWTTVTFSMKNYIGIQDDRHRLIDHDHRLNEKVADLQYIVQPKLIVIDAITAGEGRMLTPRPRQLNLIILGNNQVAFDAVCSRIIGLDPRTVEHIALAEDRGFGTTDLAKIKITGDVTLDEACARAKGFQVGLVRVEKYFEGTAITAYSGPPPEPERTSYCWGGCPGALEEAIEILRLYDAQCDAKMPRMHIVFGAYAGKIDAKPGEKVVFIGDCASFDGKIGGELVQIKSVYKDRDTKDPHHVRADDIYAKMVGVMAKMATTRNDQVLRLEGCPVSVAEQVLTLVSLAGTTNPYLVPGEILRFNRGYVGWRTRQLWNKVAGRAYQVRGPTERGDGAPRVADAPPGDPR